MEEEQKHEESEVNNVLPETPKLSDIAGAIQLLEHWVFFDNGGSEVRQSLSVISKRFIKLFCLETKKPSKIYNFSKKL